MAGSPVVNLSGRPASRVISGWLFSSGGEAGGVAAPVVVGREGCPAGPSCAAIADPGEVATVPFGSSAPDAENAGDGPVTVPV